MLQKTIIQGRLDFGKQRSFDKALQMFRHRLENYYKSELIIKEEEELFDEEQLSLEIPRNVQQTTDKYWKNTIDILSYLAQFAVAGKICAWMVEEGKVLNYHLIEPNSDKMVVRQFHKGKDLSEESGKEKDALKALDKAIQKYDRHSQAYERRGHINYLLKNTEEALHDFSKAILLDEANADAYYGRGHVYYRQELWEKAVEDFERVAQYALALQPVYWMARRHLADCYMRLGNFKKAEFNLKLYTRRPFSSDDPNFAWRQWAYFQYGKTLLQLQKFDQAAKAFDQAIAIEEGESDVKIPRSQRLTFRGIAKMKSGSKGYLSDWKEAAEMGDNKAESLLKEYA